MADRQVTMRISLKSDEFREAMEEAGVNAEAISKTIQEHDRRLGELTKIAFAGTWRADVAAFEMHSDLERLPEVDRLLGRAVRQAAANAKADAIDSARSAAAACREVYALQHAVDRIVAILEAP